MKQDLWNKDLEFFYENSLITSFQLSKLYKYNITKLSELLLFFPYKYLDKRFITPINNCLKLEEYYQIQGTIISSKLINKRILHLVLADETAQIKIIFFNITFNSIKSLSIGNQIRCFGKLSEEKYNNKLIVHPKWQIITKSNLNSGLKIQPIYRNLGIANYQFEAMIKKIFYFLQEHPLNNLLYCYIKDYKDINKLFELIHLPKLKKERSLNDLYEKINNELSYFANEELVSYFIAYTKQAKVYSVQSLIYNKNIINKFINKLDFKLTDNQHKIYSEIINFLINNPQKPMKSLLQGDVGSGKTIIAIIVSLFFLTNNSQVAFSVPSTILAHQHYNELIKLFQFFDYEVKLLTSKTKFNERKQIYKLAKSNKPLVIIGTHALFSEKLEFNNLQLIIFDEQHRFGVNQRLNLINKAKIPHQLLISATPIPRTLLMSFYTDLTVYSLTQMPKGRKPTITSIINETKRDNLIVRIEKFCQTSNQQVFWLSNQIDEDDNKNNKQLDLNNIKKMIMAKAPKLRVEIIHGKLKDEEKINIMQNFIDKKFDVLVATTVIEVGINVINANIIIIETPEKLGLAQLHQLRGRVGRAGEQGYCILVSKIINEKANNRLSIFKNILSGFLLAEQDLKIRGGGDIFGTNQSGNAMFKIADLTRDYKVLNNAKSIAGQLIKQQDLMTKKSLINRWFDHQNNFIKA